MGKKILILTASWPTVKDPVNGIMVFEQAQLLSQKYKVIVLFVKFAKWKGFLNSCQGELDCYPEENFMVYRVSVFLLPVISRILSFLRLHELNCLTRTEKVFKRILKNHGKFDVIHAHFSFPSGWIAACLGKRYAIPVVVTEHAGFEYFTRLMAEAKQRRLIAKTLRTVDRVIAVSPAQARFIRRHLEDVNLAIVGNLIRTNFFSPVVLDRGPGVFFFTAALMTEVKGLDYLLKALRVLLDRGRTSFNLFIGGDGAISPKLKKMATDLGVKKYCHFLGLLNRDQIRLWMQKTHVFISSSLSESFGIVIGEAMACGKPVIATRCGGPEFIVTDENGILVQPGDATALADAMENFILGNRKFDATTIREGVVRKFGEEAFFFHMEEIYNSVIRN